MTSPGKPSEQSEQPLSPEFEAAQEMVMGPFKPLLEALARAAVNLGSEALSAPRTYRRKLLREIEGAAKKIEIKVAPEEYQRAIAILFREGRSHGPEILRRGMRRALLEFKEQFSKLPEYHSLQALAKAAEAVSAKSAKECQDALSKIDHETTNQKMLLAVALLNHANKTPPGELRAEYAMHATKRVSELLYKPYMRTLLLMFILAKQQNVKDVHKMDYGSLFQELRKRSFLETYPSLLDEDAVFFRNAEAHEQWDYLYETDQIEAWDKHKKHKKLISVTELLERTSHMAGVAGSLFPGYIRAREFVSLDNIVGPLWEALADLIGSEPKMQQENLLGFQQKVSNTQGK